MPENVLIEIDQKELFSLVNLRTVPYVVDMMSVNNLTTGRKAESFRRRETTNKIYRAKITSKTHTQGDV